MTESLFEGRTAVVTGGARGLGLAMAMALARHGADVAIMDRLDAAGTAAQELASSTGRKAIGVTVDVTDEASVTAAFRRVDDEFGVATILVNSAGVSLGTPALDMSVQAWRRIIDVNLTGTFLTAREFAGRAVRASATATIVNVSSMSGYVVNVPQAQTAYNVSKAGVVMLTKSLAVEWLPRGIRVNAIAPGYFASDMTRDFVAGHPEMANEWISRIPEGRMGEPDELGGLVVYLASERSRYVVGQNILIDGGYTIV